MYDKTSLIQLMHHETLLHAVCLRQDGGDEKFWSLLYCSRLINFFVIC